MKWLLLLGLVAVGCGENPPPTVGDSGSGVPIGTMNGTGGVGGAGGGGGEGGATSKGACDNASDIDAIEGAMGSLRDVASACGRTFDCATRIGNSDSYGDCVSACVETGVTDLSTECAACYGGLERCGLSAFCRAECQSNNCSALCLNCLNDADCITNFEDCRGLPGDSCPG